MREEIEVMRVVRVPPMGKLVVEASGERVQGLANVKNTKVKQRLLAAIGELVSFVGGYEVLIDAGLAPPLSAPAPVPSPKEAEELAESLTEEQAAFLESLERDMKRSTEDTTEAELAAPALPIEEEPKVATLEEKPASKPTLNLVSEIDEILQQYVQADASLAHRSIHLEQPPGGILTIRVDGKAYEHPNEIEDPTVRQVLKMALKEWESR